ncbi:cobalamin biosynthesis protein CobW [Pararhodospirillum oryzae]|uniref:Cobalamin biosynthesis protein CobW n=1 Tax=Pararhodospirillum oryzae TaxID=478448 RepID=A0A512H6T2_9PROT|nr:cobalamin biosynthesis protein CobW [Pararhodospirillum oryzae]GEO81176.1 cobalamin biosynthesis protein CobW [Pararhodospirillum oryzae]
MIEPVRHAPVRLPATVITGFLGAGKTTLIRHLMTHAQGRRLALIINEFGDVGVDRDILRACGVPGCEDDAIVELANGCLCCTVADEFIPTMEALLARPEPPDHILIETSGLALPKPLVRAFDWPAIRARVTVDGVIAVVDGPGLTGGRFDPPPPDVVLPPDHDNPLEEVFSDQIACADLVLLNKADLLDDATREALSARLLERARPGTRVLATVQGVVDPAVLLGLGAGAEDDLDSRPSHHDTATDHNHDDFVSFDVRPGPVADPAAFLRRLRLVIEAHDILRVKGGLAVPGKPMRHLVQAVGPRVSGYYDRPWGTDEEPASCLVVIGLKGLDQAAIRAALEG